MSSHDFTLALAAESHDYAPCDQCDERTWRGDLDDDDVCDWCRAEEEAEDIEVANARAARDSGVRIPLEQVIREMEAPDAPTS